MIESGVTFDCAQLVIDDEIASMILQVVQGFRVDDEALAVEDIATVGPFGDFLSLDATLRHMREQSQPRYLDRRVREDWEASGAQGAYDAAKETAKQILAEYHPAPLDDAVTAQIDAVVLEAEERGQRG